MSRKGCSTRPPQEYAGWPVEWTCAGIVVLAVLAISQASNFAPSFFVGQCTSLSGMCTPARCSCAEPLRKRELVTQDAQACYQCVAEFCPAVSEGDQACTTAACECDDPTWPKMEIQVDGQSCWQCVRPSLEFTARVGTSEDACLMLAPTAMARAFSALGEESVAAAPTGVASVTGNPARRLVNTRNRSECVPLRYNGARITEKHSNNSCLAWSSFGEHWGLVECDHRDPLMHFKQLTIPEAASPVEEVYCSGAHSDEYCIEVVDILCTEEEGRCSVEQCRCEDPEWTRHELQMHNGSACFSCAPPPRHCGTDEDTCSPGSCECADPSHVKVMVETDGAGPEEAQQPCYRCQLPQSRGTEVSILSTLVLVVIASLLGGCFVRRLRDPEAGSTNATARKQKRQCVMQAADEPRSWSERWAEELEDAFEGLYEAFVENPALLVRWLRPHLRQVGKTFSNLLDTCDLALEPVYCVIDVVQAWAWDTLVAQHERLVAVVAWVCDKYCDFAQLVSSGFQRGNTPGGTAKAKGRRTKAREDKADVDAAKTDTDVGAAPAKQKARSGKPRPEAQQHDSRPEPDCMGPLPGQPDDLSWDPLGSASGDGVAMSTMPEELMRRLAGAQRSTQPQSPPPSNSSARSASQLRVQRKLQQRREALAQQQQQQQQRAAPGPQPEVQEPPAPIDESWIDELEREESKSKLPGKKASKASRKKQASKEASSGASKVVDPPIAVAVEESSVQEFNVADGCQLQEEKEVTAVQTPPRAESVAQPVCQQDHAKLEEAVAVAAAVAEESRKDCKAEREAAREDEDGAATVDTERLLGEAMHSLFLLVSSNGKAASEEQAEQPDESEETQEEAQEETQEEADEEAEAGEVEEVEEAEEAGEEEIADAEEEVEEEEEEVEERVGQETEGAAEVEEQMESVQQKVDEPPLAKPLEEPVREEPVLSAKQRKRKAKAAAAAAAAATPVSPFPNRPVVGATAQPLSRSQASKELPQQQLQQQQLHDRTDVPARQAGPRVQAPMVAAARPAVTEIAHPKSAAGSFQAGAARPRREPTAESTAPKPGDTGAQRAWASVVAGWAGTHQEASEDYREVPDTDEERLEPRLDSAMGGAEAPEFVPFAMMQQPMDSHERLRNPDQHSWCSPVRKGSNSSGRGFGRHSHDNYEDCDFVDARVQGEYEESFTDVVTTIMATGIDPKVTQEDFMMQLDSWGLIGTYDFLHLPMDDQTQLGAGYAFINFIDPAFVLLFCWIYHEFQFQGTVTPAEVQGMEANHSLWQDAVPEPAVIPNPAPSQWSVNTVNAMLSPQFREQFRKTKMCAFFRKGRCEMGAGCPFAHSTNELLPAPDLAKTKLCFSHFRGRCNDQRCKFAHGSQELRSVWVPYSPGVWFFGSEDAVGTPCYPAEGDMQMDCMAGAVVGYPLMEQHLNGFLHGGEVPVLGELPPVIQDQPEEEMVQGVDCFNEVSELPVKSGSATSSFDMGDGIALRVRGTFMEVMHLTDTPVMKRSLSEGDLEALSRCMEDAADC